MHRDDGFPDFFPDECPPDCADLNFTDVKTFRMTNEEREITILSFRSYFEEEKPLNRPNKLFRDYAISVFDELQGLLNTYEASSTMRQNYPSKNVLMGTMKEKSGAILKQKNNPHISWWIKKDYNPAQEFKFLKEE